jgi:hypothetical protein
MLSNRNASLLAIIFVVVLLVPLSGCVTNDGNDDEQKLTLTMGTPSVAPRNDGSQTVWDAELAINKITPKDAEAKWATVSMVIKRHDGSVLLQVTPVSTDSGMYGSAVEVWYMDTTGGRNVADAGDKLKVTGMSDSEYEGATIQILHRGTLIGSSVMPTNFP